MQTILIVFLAKYLYLFVIGGIVLLFLFSDYKKQIALRALFTLPLAFLLSLLFTRIVLSPRPFLLDHTVPLIQSATDNGFPSDHTLLVATLAMILFFAHKRISLMFLFLSLLVGIGRVLAGVHHPFDILGSFIIAVISSVLISKILSKYTMK